ncbi:MAG TPA: hypothetical protein VMJ35_12585 [Dongiaceae bacterium]|nr:hypothetical protein [Dongiaceae bacterium]
MTEERKHALLLAATILSARKLAELESTRPSPAKFMIVDRAIELAKFILQRIDERWPNNEPAESYDGKSEDWSRRRESNPHGE